MLTPLNRVIIFVGDVQRCARFYCDVRKFGSLALCDGNDPEGHVFQISNRA